MESPEQKTSPNPDQKPKLPETLQPGRNFYDQPPFRRAISEVCTQTGTDPQQVRALLTSLARLGIETHMAGEARGQELSSEQLAAKINDPYDPDVKKVFDNKSLFRKTSPDYFRAMGEIAERLKAFPLWHNYVNEQRAGPYISNGEPTSMRAKIKGALPLTYLNYYSIKIRSARQEVLHGLAETFTQTAKDFTQGKSRPRQNWTTKHEAEIVKK